MTKHLDDKDLGNVTGAGGTVDIELDISSTTGSKGGLQTPDPTGGGGDHSEDITNDGANPAGDDGVTDISRG